MDASNLESAIIVLVGLLMVAFHRKLGSIQVAGQNLLWGLRMGERSVTVSRYAILMVGMAAILIGVCRVFV